MTDTAYIADRGTQRTGQRTGQRTTQPWAAERMRLVIDLAACDRCEGCGVVCGPAYGDGAGAMLSLREHATFELVCRRCAHASCIVACPFDALERSDAGGVIKRHNLRCVSCKSCALACPFGTIYSELLPFYSLDYASACRACMGETPPSCVATCKHGALEYRLVRADEPDVHVVDEFLAARVRKWVRQEPDAERAP